MYGQSSMNLCFMTANQVLCTQTKKQKEKQLHPHKKQLHTKYELANSKWPCEVDFLDCLYPLDETRFMNARVMNMRIQRTLQKSSRFRKTALDVTLLEQTVGNYNTHT